MASFQTALDMYHDIQSGKQTAISFTEACLSTIQRHEPSIDAFNLLTSELALESAQAVDQRVKNGETLPLLAGVPLAMKDNINIAGYPTTCSSRILEGYVSPYDATVYRRLKQHLIPVVGKTNMDEFAMGSSNENSAFKLTRNPWDRNRVPGGSSGGSAAAVACGMVPLGIGSDTGGSVRQPASFCGIVGIKPTYGLVSRYGLVAFASSLDQISPFGRTVKDTAALLQVISGSDPMDATAIQNLPSQDYLKSIGHDIQGLRIGVVDEFSGEGFQSDVIESFQQALTTFETLGSTLHRVSIPNIRHAILAYYILATAEASSNLGRYDGIRYGFRAKTPESDLHTLYRQTRSQGFGEEVKRRIMLGTFCLSAGYYEAYYGKAQKIRELLKKELAQAFQHVDVLASPTSPTTAFRIGEKTANPVHMYLSDIATLPVNMAGIPAISIPCGFDQNHLPIGLQLMGPHLSESRLFQIAYAFEQHTGLTNLTPPAS